MRLVLVRRGEGFRAAGVRLEFGGWRQLVVGRLCVCLPGSARGERGVGGPGGRLWGGFLGLGSIGGHFPDV